MEALKTTIHSTFEAFRLRSNPPKAKEPLNRASEPFSISSQFSNADEQDSQDLSLWSKLNPG